MLNAVRHHRRRKALVLGLLLGAGLGTLWSGKEVIRKHRLVRGSDGYGAYRASLQRIAEPAVVFVRFAADHNPHVSLVHNRADYKRARLILAHDLGGRNRELMDLEPRRAFYRFDEATQTLVRLSADERLPR